MVIKAKLKPIKGTFEAPEDAYWKDNAKGTAKWEEPDNGGTGQYEVELRKGSTKIYTTETTGKTFNFYPYMTQAGTYTFRVRTIAKTSKQDDYGKNSEWVESDEIYLAKEVAATTTTQAAVRTATPMSAGKNMTIPGTTTIRTAVM